MKNTKNLIIVCLSLLLFSCATLPEQESHQLPLNYQLVLEFNETYRIKTPDGNIIGPQWRTKNGAINYAIYYDSLLKNK